MARWHSIAQALRGRPGSRPSDSNVESTIRYATDTPAGQRIDTKAAAAELGVSRRTLQRWIQQGRFPDPKRSPAARNVHTKVNDRYDQREQERRDRRRARLVRTGAPVSMRGEVQVSGDKRRRNIAGVELTGDHLELMYQAYDLAGDDGALDAFGAAMSDAYGVPGLEVVGLDHLDL